jgi:hypothetical protein
LALLLLLLLTMLLVLAPFAVAAGNAATAPPLQLLLLLLLLLSLLLLTLLLLLLSRSHCCCCCWSGRVSHSDLLPNNLLPVAPSAIGMSGKLYVEGGVKKDYEVPRALEVEEIKGIVEDFAKAAEVAVEVS